MSPLQRIQTIEGHGQVSILSYTPKVTLIETMPEGSLVLLAFKTILTGPLSITKIPWHRCALGQVPSGREGRIYNGQSSLPQRPA